MSKSMKVILPTRYLIEALALDPEEDARLVELCAKAIPEIEKGSLSLLSHFGNGRPNTDSLPWMLNEFGLEDGTLADLMMELTAALVTLLKKAGLVTGKPDLLGIEINADRLVVNLGKAKRHD